MLATNTNSYNKNYYYSLPENTRVELINGVIYNMSPAPLRIHQKLVGKTHYKLQKFIEDNNGKCEVYIAPFDVELSDHTVVQPDISVICDPSKLTEKGCTGAPDWIIEITSSNYSHDYVDKLKLYFDNKVREYWIINPQRETVEVHLLSEDYVSNSYTFNDTIPVGIYNGKLQITVADFLK